MSELNDLFKQLAEAKASDPLYQKEKKLKDSIKESVKGDLGGLFSQLAEVKSEDPAFKKAKQIKENVKADLGSLFSELSSLKKKQTEMIEEHPQLAEEIVEEVTEFEPELVEEVLTEIAPLPTPVGVQPPEAQIPGLDKYLKAPTKKEQEQEQSPYLKEFKTLNDKIKFLEQWVGKIQNAGPGSGEVNLRYLDDVDRSSIGVGKFLTYNPGTKKFYFASVSGDGAAQIQSDWNQTDNASADYIKNKPSIPTIPTNVSSFTNDAGYITSVSWTQVADKPTLFSGNYADLTDKPTIPSLTGYATETYVNTSISNLVGAAPDALNTLKEIADQLANDESAVSSLTTTVAGKVSLTGSYANPSWLTSFDYSKLINKPTIPTATSQLTNDSRYIVNTDGASLELNNVGVASLRANDNVVIQANAAGWTFAQNGRLTFPDSTYQTTAWTGTYSYTDLTNKPTLFSGSYTDLTNKPALFSGSYTDLTNKPTLFSGAASDLTGTALNSTIVSSSLTSVGQLTNLQVAGGASVTNNSATDHYINVGTIGQFFDDGNLHIHAKIGNVWINSLDGGDINLGLQSNSGASNVKVANDLQSKTAYKARTSWNAALNTEITLDNYRYRVTSSGGTYPQVISNISGTTVNSSWVSVATVSGAAIAQTGSTGTLLPNNSWTNLYSAHGLDSSGDMVVTTITDKAHGIVHRVTFIRNDDGATTGYSIFAEKLW